MHAGIIYNSHSCLTEHTDDHRAARSNTVTKKPATSSRNGNICLSYEKETFSGIGITVPSTSYDIIIYHWKIRHNSKTHERKLQSVAATTSYLCHTAGMLHGYVVRPPVIMETLYFMHDISMFTYNGYFVIISISRG